MATDWRIRRCAAPGEEGWLRLREALWPHCTREQHLAEMHEWCTDPLRYAVFLALEPGGEVVGFAEASIRSDYVNGTETSPVGFLEGIYVAPGWRNGGVARALTEKVERWTASRGCRELASDADLDNIPSHRMHRALGFEETERVVYFRKWIA